uniref:Uncharacterized protein n=1 Tax=Arundo donax TaxID=35708 RepID=A0A0A9BZ71_ARUDO
MLLLIYLLTGKRLRPLPPPTVTGTWNYATFLVPETSSPFRERRTAALSKYLKSSVPHS